MITQLSTQTSTSKMPQKGVSSTSAATSINNPLFEKIDIDVIQLKKIMKSELLTSLSFLGLPEDYIRRLMQVVFSELKQGFKDSIKDFNSVFEGEGYKITRDRLIELLREEDENECKPSDYAFNLAWDLFIGAASQLQGRFSKATVAADDEGGIRLRWRNLDKTREVSLYCPSSPGEKAYIYHEMDDEYDADYKVFDSSLARWLSWLTQK